MRRLENKVAAVLGGASGVGAAAGRLFLAEGAAVMIIDGQPIDDAALAAAITHSPGRAHVYEADLHDEDAIAAACELAQSLWGDLSVAVAAEPAVASHPFDMISGAEWDSHMARTVRALAILAKYAIPQMVAGGGGSLVAVSSVLAMAGAAGRVSHSAASGAIRSFTKAAACEWVHQDIRANSIHAGLPCECAGPEALLRSAVTAEDVGWGCVFLASDEARFISGAELVIDGGMIAALPPGIGPKRAPAI